MKDNITGTSFEESFWKNNLRPGKLLLLWWLLFMFFVPQAQTKALVNKPTKLKNSYSKEFIGETLIQDIQRLAKKFATTIEEKPKRMNLHGSKMKISDHEKETDFPDKYNAYHIPNSIINFKTFFLNRRRKRELEKQEEISAAVMSIRMPSYYPFIMAEMIPGSVETRHPSIIAVKGCPAYYIADHKGRCKQVFQYTVNFQQRSVNSENPQRSFFHHPRIQKKNGPFFNSSPLIMSRIRAKKILPYARKDIAGNHPRLLTLLRLAAKKFNLNIQKADSSSSAELKKEDVPRAVSKKLKISQITDISDFQVDSTKHIDSRDGEKINANANVNDSDD